VELNRITNSQSDQGSVCGISTDASCLNHNSEDETGFRDKPTAIDGSSSKIHATCRGKSSQYITVAHNLGPGTPIQCT